METFKWADIGTKLRKNFFPRQRKNWIEWRHHFEKLFLENFV